MLLNAEIRVKGFVASRYNVLCSTENGIVLLYNLLYKQLVELDNEDLVIIERGSIDPETEFGRMLVGMRYAIPESANELDYYKFHYNRSHFDQSALSLSILTSLACNLSCPYCYENKNGLSMKVTTANQVKDWVVNNLDGKRMLSVNWFGGEPLLNMKSIEMLSEAFIAHCSASHIDYQAGITTNGCLLTPEVVETLERCQVFNVQVTFDGSEAYHNKMKRFSNGEGSYKKNVENIVNYCTHSKSHLPLRIRVNLSDENYESIETLLNELPDVVKEHSSIFFRWIYSTETSGWKEFSEKKAGSSPYKGIFALIKMAHEKGYHVENRCEAVDFRFCEADNPGYYTIDPLGNIYLCVHDYKPEVSVGHVRDGIHQSKEPQYLAFRNVSVLDDNECLQCKVLPICNGGCKKFRLEGKKQCIFEKDNLDLYVENIYHRNTIV